MNLQILKPILVGAALGAALFWIPFFVAKAIIFLLIVGMIFRVFGSRRHHYRGPVGWAYADKIRGMSDEDYENFKASYAYRRGCSSRRNNEGETKIEEK